MANPDKFKDMTCTIKIGKKRTSPDFVAPTTSKLSETPSGIEPDNLKRQKTDESGVAATIDPEATESLPSKE